MKISTPLALALLLLTTLVRADEIEDAMNAALKAYKEGNNAAASTALKNAQNLINAKAGLVVAAALPDMIGDWKGGKVENKGLDSVGGGQAVERSYRKGSKEKGNEKKATVAITVDSPLMKTVQTGLANPALGSLLGTKVAKIGEYQALMLPKQGLLQMIVSDRFLINVQAKKLSEAELTELAAGVKADVLKLLP